jgi:hypothetical protein
VGVRLTGSHQRFGHDIGKRKPIGRLALVGALAVSSVLTDGRVALAATINGVYLALTYDTCGALIPCNIRSTNAAGVVGDALSNVVPLVRAESRGRVSYQGFGAYATASSWTTGTIQDAQKRVGSAGQVALNIEDKIILRSPGQTGLARLTLDTYTEAFLNVGDLLTNPGLEFARGRAQAELDFQISIGNSRQEFGSYRLKRLVDLNTSSLTGRRILFEANAIEKTQGRIGTSVSPSNSSDTFSWVALANGIDDRSSFVVPLNEELMLRASFVARADAGTYTDALVDAERSGYFGAFKAFDFQTGAEIPFSLTSESGFDYTAPIVRAIPLSPSLVLLASGAALLVGVSRRGRRSVSAST